MPKKLIEPSELLEIVIEPCLFAVGAPPGRFSAEWVHPVN
jgi:hypothetical protein